MVDRILILLYNIINRKKSGGDFMRIKLEKYLDKKIEVQATYKNYAITNNRRHDLFLNVCLDDEEISNHIWIKLKKSQQKKLSSAKF